MHKLFPRSGFFDFETVRILGTTCYGGADVAEVLEAVGDIRSDDPSSWEEAWRRQSWRAEALADDARDRGDRDAALRGYLRASNYARASGYMYVSGLGGEGGEGGEGGDGDVVQQDPRALPVADKVGRLFRQALPLMEGEVRVLSIPYDDGEHVLPGYLYLPPPSRRIPGRNKIPVLVNTGGADSCQEELYYLNPAAGPGLGYAVLTFDGPGQGIMVRRHGLQMRPDWEAVTGCVIDHLEAYSAQHPGLDLDMDSIAVSGASMGGYYALRAASDRRVKACVAIVRLLFCFLSLSCLLLRYSFSRFKKKRIMCWIDVLCLIHPLGKWLLLIAKPHRTPFTTCGTSAPPTSPRSSSRPGRRASSAPASLTS